MTVSNRLTASIRLVTLLAIAGCANDDPADVVTLLETPAATGSIAPNLATGPDNTTVLSWIEPLGDGHALRFSVYEDSDWGDPRTVATGDNWFVNWADFPSVVPLSDDLWGAHWLVSQPAGGYAYDVFAAISGDRGDTWSDPFTPHTDNTPTEHGFVTLYNDAGQLGMVWLDGRKMINDYDESDVTSSGMTLRAGSFGDDNAHAKSSVIDELICDCCQTDVAVTSDGPVVVYRDRTVNETRDIYVSRRVSGQWQPGRPVSDDGWHIDACPVNGPVVEAKGAMLVVAWFTAANDKPTVKLSWSSDAGRTFAEPINVDVDSPLGHVGGVLLDNGEFVIGWHRAAGDGGAQLLLRRMAPNGDHGEIQVLEAAANVFRISVPQVSLVGSDVLVAWTTRSQDINGVKSATVPLKLLN